MGALGNVDTCFFGKFSGRKRNCPTQAIPFSFTIFPKLFVYKAFLSVGEGDKTDRNCQIS